MRSIGAKLFWVVAVLVLFLASGCARQLSDEVLFRESVAAAKTADGDNQWYAFNEIAKAQAEQGYYADALETLRFVDKFSSPANPQNRQIAAVVMQTWSNLENLRFL